MTLWNIIKLELAPSDGFPVGSAGRSYILRLPLTEEGLIDQAVCKSHPNEAIVRRFWPNEPDQSGNIIRNTDGWKFCFRAFSKGEPGWLQYANQPFRVGGFVSIVEPGGLSLPYRIVSVVPG